MEYILILIVLYILAAIPFLIRNKIDDVIFIKYQYENVLKSKTYVNLHPTFEPVKIFLFFKIYHKGHFKKQIKAIKNIIRNIK